jgi:ribonuclease BN (tRNA processing enzyme)
VKIHFFGTCAGTVPRPNRKHISFSIEKDNVHYWFDAGEGCSYTAHLMGIDLLSIRAIFISHTHMDHVGGLGNLFWNINKLNGIKSNLIKGKEIKLFIPNLKTWEGILQVLANTEGGFKHDFNITENLVVDGEIFNENGFCVTAQHNYHMARRANEPWRSFSFLIEAENKRIVYSGDIRDMKDIDNFIDKCDILLMETGHHLVEDVCNYIKNNNKQVLKLYFIHNGKEILENPNLALQKAIDILGEQVFIPDDKTTIEI